MSNTPTTIRRRRTRRIAGLATAGVVGLAAAAAIPALAAERGTDPVDASGTPETVNVADTSVTATAPALTADQRLALAGLSADQVQALAAATPESFQALVDATPEQLEYLQAMGRIEAMTPEEYDAFLKFITPPPPAPAYHASVSGASSAGSTGGSPGGFLACVRNRESHGNYSVVNGSSGAGGAYQFLPSSWQALGFASRFGVARAEQATPAQQDQAAAETYARMGRSPWAGPGC